MLRRAVGTPLPIARFGRSTHAGPTIPRLFFALLLFVLSMAMLTGCGTLPKQPFVKSAQEPIKKIAILPPESPPELRVVNIGGVGGAFGLIGAAIAASDEESKSETFTMRMRLHKLALGKELAEALEAQLKDDGYELTAVSGKPVVIDEAESQFDDSALETEADAILHVWFTSASYVCPGDSTDYFPQVGARARLISAKTRSRLYDQTFYYGRPAEVENLESLPSDGTYVFDDFDALMVRSTDAKNGLRDGARGIGRRIGEQLR